MRPNERVAGAPPMLGDALGSAFLIDVEHQTLCKVEDQDPARDPWPSVSLRRGRRVAARASQLHLSTSFVWPSYPSDTLPYFTTPNEK